MHLVAAFMLILLSVFLIAIPEPIKTTTNASINVLFGLFIVLGILIAFITIVYNKLLANKKNNNIVRFIEISSFAVIAIIATRYQWWVPLVYAALCIVTISIVFYLERNANKPEYVEINETGIILKRINKKLIPWSEVKNLLVRHGNVTINLKNNTLYQYNAFEFKNITNKDEIEAFAAQQIVAHQHKYQEDW